MPFGAHDFAEAHLLSVCFFWPLKITRLGVGEVRFRLGIFFLEVQLGRLSSQERELLGWKHPRAQILGKKGLKKKEMKEEKMRHSLKFVYLLFSSF